MFRNNSKIIFLNKIRNPNKMKKIKPFGILQTTLQFIMVSFFFVLTITSPEFVEAQTITQSDTIHYGENAQNGKYLSVRGFKMYYEIYGNGEPILLIHGNGGSINSFLYQIPYFSINHKIIAVDSRAQGKSIDVGDSLSFEMMADDFNALLEAINIDSCSVIGWSDGGINGLLLAIRHPSKVKKLAITGANLWPDSTAIKPSDFKWMQEYNKTLSKMEQTDQIKQQQKLLLLDLKEPHINDQQLKLIHCPVLVIGGDHDIILPQHTLHIAESIPGSYLWILPNSGHSTLIDHKKDFNEVVSNFIDHQLIAKDQ
jgi:pimeloyl-ACP methyl ester carboxylesterase